ncbi:MAG: hypothetical protein LBK66_06695 [Spirochaetaceae bacterium]|jgi:hypothetical protein|nr:hypothetical protein [Spirochaetaceae bacterium]
MATMIGMTAEQAAEAGKSLTFEKVWAAMDRYSEEADKRFQELERVMKENDRILTERFKETDRVIKEVGEQQKETDRVLTERFKETDRVIKEIGKRIDQLSKNIGGLNNSMGTLIETLISARLWEKFKGYGLKEADRHVYIYDETGRYVSEIDILLSNTDCAMAIEVKTHLNKTEDVDGHLKRMELIRRYPPIEIGLNNKRLMGAMAGGVVDSKTMEYAYKCGFFVLELAGDLARIVEPPAGFKPKEW